MREAFEAWNPTERSLERVARARKILTEYAAEGYDLTLRQMFYQFVARGWIENTQRAYSRIGDTIAKARMAGLIDWSHIVDRGRSTYWPSHWSDPADIVDAAAESFRIDKWAEQPNHVEVMVEKDALSGVLSPVCAQLDVRFTPNRGYSSLSHFYRIGKRLQAKAREKTIWVLYLGDHDPSGLDMDRDIKERLELFSQARINFERLALTMDQIERWDPPPNPTKLTDSRAGDYVALYGRSSWELDAVEPRTLAALVRDRVEELREPDAWADEVEREDDMRQELEAFVESYRAQN